MRFSLEHLEAFITAIETGSFSAAARKLGKAQSQISSSIASLETDLGVDLFDRSGKYPTLTHEGDQLRSRALEVLKKCHHLTEQADRLVEGGQVLLRIAVDELVPPKVLAEVLADFADMFPEIEVEILWGAMGDVATIVSTGKADVGIDLPADNKALAGFSWRVLASTDFCNIVAPTHPLAKREQITEDDLNSYRQILPMSREGNRLPDDFRFGSSVWQCEDSRLIRELILAKVGWSTLIRYQVVEELQKGTMVELPTKFGEHGLEFMFAYIWNRNKTLSEAEAWLMEKAEKALQNLCRN